MVDGMESWWRFIALTIIVAVLTISASLAFTSLWTDLLRARVRSQQETVTHLELLVDGLRREVEQMSRTDLSRGIEMSQLTSRIEKMESRLYGQEWQEPPMDEIPDY